MLSESNPIMRMRASVLFLSVLLALSVPSVARAEIKIAIVDVQMLLTESKAAQSIQKQVQTEREKLQNEFAGYEQKLRDSEKQLVDKRGEMSPEEFTKQRDEFQKKLQETGGLVQKKKRTLETALVKATGKLRAEILKIVAQMAEKDSYDIVLTRQNIVLVAKEFDISQQVLDTINKEVSNIPLEMSE